MKKFYNFMTCCIKKSKQILDFSLIVLDLMKTQDQCDGTGEKKQNQQECLYPEFMICLLEDKKNPHKLCYEQLPTGTHFLLYTSA